VKRRWKVLIGVVIALAALLTVNTIVTDNETKSAAVTIDGGRIVQLTGGEVQVYAQGPKRGQPIVLLHCYTCSLHWWDALAPILARTHPVIRIDLLGFGGSEKPSSGYSIPTEAQLVAEALNRLGVQGAIVVGHSLGFSVATELAAQSSELVDRAVDIDQAPDSSFGGQPLLTKLGYVPVIGQASWRLAPDFLVRDTIEDAAFAPGYDVPSGFGDQIVRDFRAMTYTSYKEMHDAEDDYTDQEPLDQRIRDAAVPLLVIFGTEDQVWDDPTAAANAYRDVPGAEIAMVKGAGHSPNVEQPAETAHLIEEFAANPGDEGSKLPRRIGLGKNGQ
jgi:pimeloyl-ACP methyl ester carboxylesterase